MIGSTISHYKILEKLGEGGMGVVYKAQDLDLQRFVALKFLPAHVSTAGPERERFLQEARSAASLNHPNICVIYGIERQNDQQFIAMEYVDGKTLRQLQATGLSPEVLLKYTIQIAEALFEAHRKEIIHRDIKPDNIMVNSMNQIKVMDFGLAKLKGSLKLTKTSSTVGTTSHMAPEQLRGEDIDARSDIFSLGILIHELFTGTLPFRGEHEAAIMYSIINEEPRRFPTGGSPLQYRVEAITKRMLEKDPSRRYQSMDAVAQDLRAVETGSGIHEVPSSVDTPSIAVLPFADLSPSKDQEYFCDGIAEEIINALTKLNGLQVVARTSAFAFKGKNQDIRDIGTKLNVSTVLEGSLRKAGKRLRISVQLINVADGYHLWSERYDREEEDVFAVQDEISQAIVRALKIQLVGGQQSGLVQVHTDNLEAYNLYLQGRHAWGKRTADGLRKSIDYFQRAIKEEPLYGLAYAALADSYCLLCSYHILSPKESIPAAKQAALRSVELNPSLAEAHEALGHVIMLYEWDWERARKEYAESISLNPLFSTAHQRHALLMTLRGEHSAAQEEIRKAEKLDPLSLIIVTDTALVSYINGNYEQALEICKRVASMNPQFYVSRFVAGLAHEQLGRFEEAEAEFRIALQGSGNSTIIRSSLAHCHAQSGKKQEAIALLDELRNEKTYVSPYSIAIVQVALGNTDDALTWLSKAFEERSTWHIHLHLSVDPRLKELRENEQFASLLHDMKIR